MLDHKIQLLPENNDYLRCLGGVENNRISFLEVHYDVRISQRGFKMRIQGNDIDCIRAGKVILGLYEEAKKGEIDDKSMFSMLNQFDKKGNQILPIVYATFQAGDKTIKARNTSQQRFIELMNEKDVVFGIGPAGTGKTYLAVAKAVESLERRDIKRIVLTRPAVEAGEKLGFLPGDLSQKIDPYLRPLYDALFEMLGSRKVEKLIAKNIIEIAPLAFMRGRTLNDCHMILDEAQNTTLAQMKMFLTRIGHNAKAVVVGDSSQIDLPNQNLSGLKDIQAIFKGVKGVGTAIFDSSDVVRHPVVKRVIDAFDHYQKSQSMTFSKHG